MSTPEALDRLLQERQADRLPSVAAAVVRKGELAWSNAVGSANYDEEREATPGTQYRIGSITKTFTATAIMQLRDHGALDLDDRLGQHLDGLADGSPTIRRHARAHLRACSARWARCSSKARRRPRTTSTSRSRSSPRRRTTTRISASACSAASSRPSRACRTRTTSTSGSSGRSGSSRTTWHSQEPKAQGYLVDEYARTVWSEPETDLGGVAAMGQLWSTVEDLATWATFLARGADGVLAATTIEEMWFPQVMYCPDNWVLGWGLGLMLYNQNGKIFGGHGGAMAGHLAGVFVHRKTQIGAAALTNSGTRGNMELFAVSLVEKAMELWPEPIEPWRPEADPPDDVRALLGRWWSEGNEFVFWWEHGALQAKVVGTPPGRGETTFERDGDGWRAAVGRERGERLRSEDGQLVWAGYPFTRTQQPFKA